MDWSEIFGLIVTLFFFSIFILRPIYESFKRRKNPQEYDRQQRERQQQMKQFMRSNQIQFADEDDDEEEARLESLKKQKEIEKHKKKQAKAKKNILQPPPISSYQPIKVAPLKTELYHQPIKQRPSRGKRILQHQKSFKDVIVLNELIRLRDKLTGF